MKRFLFMTTLMLLISCSAISLAGEFWIGAIWQGTRNNDGAFIPYNAYQDWVSSGSGNASGLAPLTSVTEGQKFSLRYMSYLGAINARDFTIIPFPGLNTSFEYTIIATLPCEISSITKNQGKWEFFFKTIEPGEFFILNSIPNENFSNGTGFADGDIVAGFTVPAGESGSFTYDSTTGVVRIGYMAIEGTVAGSFPANASFLSPADWIQTIRFDSNFAKPTTVIPTAYFSGGTVFPEFTPGTRDLNLKMDSTSSFRSRCTGSIGDIVWNDQNGNGLQELEEPGIDGVKVTIKRSDGLPLSFTKTSVNMNQHGFYLFTGLCMGSYVVEVDTTTLPAGYSPTQIGQGGDRSIDSNGNPANVTLVKDDSSERTIDFGYYSLATCQGTIGDFLWHDSNRDGLQNEGEQGIDNVILNLFNNRTGDLMASTTTGPASGTPHGYYQFTNLCAQEYRVAVDASTLPAGHTETISPPGADSTLDSNGSPAIAALVTNNGSDQTIDFGYLSPCTGTIGDFVWHDANRNGIQDLGEPGIDGVTVRLYDENSPSPKLLATVTTNLQGSYKFPGLCRGGYRVEIDPSTLPAGFTPTTSLPGADPSLDSNGSPCTVTLLGDDISDLSIDFGYTSPCKGLIGDLVWEDINADGIQDSGEPGIPLILVNLKDSLTNTILQTVTTDNAGVYNFDTKGIYNFTGVCSGNYRVEAIPPAGYILTLVNTGNNRDTDSNPNPAPVQLAGDADRDLSVDFGLYRLFNLGDYVWEDINSDGLQDAGETGLGGWTLTLKQGGEVLATTTTGSDGSYSFSGLKPGIYSVCTTPMAGYSQTYDLDGLATPHCATAPLISGQNRTDIDFGYRLPLPLRSGDTATIGFWHNKNGQALIKSLNGSADSTSLATWLATQFPYLYGPPSTQDLTGRSNAEVAELFLKLFSMKGTKIDAQTLAVALAVYVTDKDLAGDSGAKYGFNVSVSGTGARMYNVGVYGSAIGLTNNVSYPIYALLLQANIMKKEGTFNTNAFNSIFDGINVSGDIGN